MERQDSINLKPKWNGEMEHKLERKKIHLPEIENKREKDESH